MHLDDNGMGMPGKHYRALSFAGEVAGPGPQGEGAAPAQGRKAEGSTQTAGGTQTGDRGGREGKLYAWLLFPPTPLLEPDQHVVGHAPELDLHLECGAGHFTREDVESRQTLLVSRSRC